MAGRRVDRKSLSGALAINRFWRCRVGLRVLAALLDSSARPLSGSSTSQRGESEYHTVSHVSAIDYAMIHMGWVGGEPANPKLTYQPGAAIPNDWHDVVITQNLACGIEITSQRSGFTVYDFAGWPPGIPASGASTQGGVVYQTLSESSRAAKPALVQRLRVINVHLTLLHAAAMAEVQESPTVVRVGERDLLRQDIDDLGHEFWYRTNGGSVSQVVTDSDRERFGVMSTSAFAVSLQWLDAVIAADLLTEFDLLNQAQTAVSTHDYPLAVVAGWTVCELRTRALASGLPGIAPRSGADGVTRALSKNGLIQPGMAARLNTVRTQRNKWLHSGKDPSEADAVAAMDLAANLLSSIVPLQLRPTSTVILL